MTQKMIMVSCGLKISPFLNYFLPFKVVIEVLKMSGVKLNNLHIHTSEKLQKQNKMLALSSQLKLSAFFESERPESKIRSSKKIGRINFETKDDLDLVQ